MFEDHKQLLNELISITKSLSLPLSTDVLKLLFVFRYRQLSLLESVQKLCDEDRWYEACILNTTMIENYILQRWLIQYQKIIAYLEYACIESLPRVKVFKDEEKEVLKFIREHGLTSLLKDGIKQTTASDRKSVV